MSPSDLDGPTLIGVPGQELYELKARASPGTAKPFRVRKSSLRVLDALLFSALPHISCGAVHTPILVRGWGSGLCFHEA